MDREISVVQISVTLAELRIDHAETSDGLKNSTFVGIVQDTGNPDEKLENCCR